MLELPDDIRAQTATFVADSLALQEKLLTEKQAAEAQHKTDMARIAALEAELADLKSKQASLKSELETTKAAAAAEVPDEEIHAVVDALVSRDRLRPSEKLAAIQKLKFDRHVVYRVLKETVSELPEKVAATRGAPVRVSPSSEKSTAATSRWINAASGK